MFSFNGTYRSKPEQSLGGVYKKEARDELVRRAAEDREKRNHFKRNTKSATKIQACYRSHKSRSSKKTEERSLFDMLKVSVANHTGHTGHSGHTNLTNIQLLSRKLNFFFNPTIEQDANRLIFLSQLIMKNKNEITALVLTSYESEEDDDHDDDTILAKSLLFFIKKLLKYNCRLISSHHKQQAIPIRFIEVFTSHETYYNNKRRLHNSNETPSNPNLYKDAIDCSRHTLFNKPDADNTPTTIITSVNNATNSLTTNVDNTITINNQGAVNAVTVDEDIPHKRTKAKLNGSQKVSFVLRSVKMYLLQNGYFSTIVSLTIQRISPSFLQSYDITKIPMATTIRDMLLRFIIIPKDDDDDDGGDDNDDDGGDDDDEGEDDNDEGGGVNGGGLGGKDEEYNKELMYRLIDEVLCLPLTSHKNEFLLPILSTPAFPFHLLIHHLSQHYKSLITTANTPNSSVTTTTNTPYNITANNTPNNVTTADDPNKTGFNDITPISNQSNRITGSHSSTHLNTTRTNNNNNNYNNNNRPNTINIPFSNNYFSTLKTDTPTTLTTTTTGFTNNNASTTYPSNLFLLHSIIQIGLPHFEHFKEQGLHNFLMITSCLVDSMEFSFYKADDEEDEDEDDADEEIVMDWSSDAHNTSQLEQLKMRCIELLSNSGSLAGSLMRSLSKGCFEDSSLVALCRICYAMLHFGKNKMAAFKTKLFNSIAFNSFFLEQAWSIISTIHTTNPLNESSALLQLISRGVSLCVEDLHTFIPLLSVFATTYNHFLLTVSDAEFHGTSGSSGLKAFTNLETVSRIALSFKDCCLGIIELTHPESKFSIKKYLPPQNRTPQNRTPQNRTPQNRTPQNYSFSLSSSSAQDESAQFVRKHRMLKETFKDAVKLVKKLYERDCRQSFCPPNCWLSSNHIIHSDKLVQSLSDSAIAYIGRPFGTLSILNSQNSEHDAPQLSNSEVRKLMVLSELPFIIPFVNRVEIFHDLVRRERMAEPTDYLMNTSSIMIRRNFLYEDAFDKLSYENEPNLKKRLKIRLVNAAGLDEAGVDGGGLFREFMGQLVKAGFDSNRGFFKTTSDKLHYPNPQSKILYPQDYLQHLYFLGRILGKIIYEEMLIEVPFASFFLCKLLSRADLDIHHLASLDPLMHRNLLFTKDFNGDVNDLQLNFTATYDNLGVVVTDELKPGGENIPVTNQNRFEYVHLMADFRLNKQIKQHSQAFRRGLSEVVPMEWLQLFDHKELQVLLSGTDTPIDVADLRRNTSYSGGYDDGHAVIEMFWKVVGGFSSVQKQMLLKFVTSCSRPPLFGFKELYPKFCIQKAGQDLERLPTSSTCMNLLKLPEFSDLNVLSSKLLYALESGSGFELS